MSLRKGHGKKTAQFEAKTFEYIWYNIQALYEAAEIYLKSTLYIPYLLVMSTFLCEDSWARQKTN